MENANVNVKRIDIMLFKEFKIIVKKDQNVAAVFCICIKHYNKVEIENFRDSFHLIVFT